MVAAALWVAAGLIVVLVAAIVISYVVGAADQRLADLNLGGPFRGSAPDG